MAQILPYKTENINYTTSNIKTRANASVTSDIKLQFNEDWLRNSGARFLNQWQRLFTMTNHYRRKVHHQQVRTGGKNIVHAKHNERGKIYVIILVVRVFKPNRTKENKKIKEKKGYDSLVRSINAPWQLNYLLFIIVTPLSWHPFL